jgi:hypothetical protein
MHAYSSPAALLCLTLTALAASPTAAQSIRAADGLGTRPYGHMRMTLERTIFQIDVLTIDVCFDSTTADRFAAFVGMEGAEDSIAAVAIRAGSAIGRIRFLRNASRNQFLDGIRDEQEKAVRAGLLSDSTFRRIGESLPIWFEFLEERGVRDGDQISYVFGGDSLRSFYRGVDGTVWLDRTDVGPDRSLSVLATWFAPETSFRKPLIRSLTADSVPPPERCAPPDDNPDDPTSGRRTGITRRSGAP